MAEVITDEQPSARRAARISVANPFKDEPPARAVRTVTRWGLLGLIWVCLRAALVRGWR